MRTHLAILAFITGIVLANAGQAAGPPNIVFFLIDDLGRTDVGFMGCNDIQTPNIDSLARSGAILDSHYVQPVCSPTRAALLTGRYATRTGVYTIVRPHAKWGLPLDERTLASALKDAGYETAITGKWHLGEFEKAYRPTSRGFDHQHGHYFGAIDYFTHVRDQSHDWYHDDKELNEEGYSTHLIAKEACRLIEKKDKTKPLFLYVPFNGVHSPMQVPEKYLAPYAKLPANRMKLAGMLSAVDEAIGDIVNSIEKAGLRDNTLIVFSSDNGGPNPKKLSTNGMLKAGKGTLYEGGVRVCAFANWPGKIKGGTTITEPMHVVDWFPTLVNLAGGDANKQSASLSLDGRDVWPMLTKGEKSPHDEILLVQSPTRAALRMGDWKLLWNAAQPQRKKSSTDQWELYNLTSDIGELKNLVSDEPKQLALMQERLMARLKDAVPDGSVSP